MKNLGTIEQIQKLYNILILICFIKPHDFYHVLTNTDI